MSSRLDEKDHPSGLRRGPAEALGRAGISRRDFLMLGGAGLAGTALLGASGCSSGSPDELVFTFWGSTFEKTAIDKMVEKFQQDHPNVQVDPQHITGDYDTKVNTLVAANNAPDVGYMGAGMGFRLAEKGKLVDIARYFDEHPELEERLPQTYYWYAPGKTYGMQTAVEIIDLWYNRDLFEAAGAELPPAEASGAWSWDQFVETAHRLTVDEGGNRADQSGFDPKNIRQFGVSSSFTGWWQALLMSNGASLTNEDGTKYALNSPESVEVFQKLQDLMYRYHVAPTPSQQGQQGETQATTTVQLQTKRVAMAIDGQWNLLDMSQSGLNFGLGVLPRLQEPKTMMLGGATVIFKSTRRPKQAMDLYLYHNNPRYVDLYKNGLWMPLEKKYYTDPDLIADWAENDVHPPEFRTAVIDYTLNNSEPDYAHRLKNQDVINTNLTPGLDLIWTGKKPAKEALDALEAKIQPKLEGLYPTG